MDTHTPRDQDDLSDFERRLSGWRPGDLGLDADAMLFAAGVAAGRRRGRLVRPALGGFMGAVVVGLALWAMSERAERQNLARQLVESAPKDILPPALAVADLPKSSYTPSPDDYFHLRRQVEQDSNRWLASLDRTGSIPLGPPLPEPPILRFGQRDAFPDS